TQTDEMRLAPQQTHSTPNAARNTAIVGSMPLYCWGGAPREPGENAHIGARYSSSTVWPGATATVMAAGPTSEGRKYGTWMLSWCWPGDTGITVRPQVAATCWPLRKIFGLMKKKNHARGKNLAVTAIAVAPPGGPDGGGGGGGYC